MKIFIIAFSFIAANAHAMSKAEVSLESTGFQSKTPSIETSYGADKELGRAWIILTLKDKTSSENAGAPTETVEVKMDGLSLDPATGNIVYEKNQEKTVCAMQKRFLTKKYFKKSKNCEINVSVETRKVDDGLKLKDKQVANVILDVVSK